MRDTINGHPIHLGTLTLALAVSLSMAWPGEGESCLLLGAIGHRSDVPLRVQIRPNEADGGRTLVVRGVTPDAEANLARTFPEPYQYQEDLVGGSSFVVAGVNTDADIRSLTTLTGASVETLTERGLTPTWFKRYDHDNPKWREHLTKGPFAGLSKPNFRFSSDGFLVRGQTVHKLLMMDNRTVTVEIGLSHQKVAEPLLRGIQAYEERYRAWVEENGRAPVWREDRFHAEFVHEGRTYLVSGWPMGGKGTLVLPSSGWVGNGIQGSLFNDDLFANHAVIFAKEGNVGFSGDVLQGDCLTAHLIYRYGFYQGGKYRMPPESIAAFFDLR